MGRLSGRLGAWLPAACAAATAVGTVAYLWLTQPLLATGAGPLGRMLAAGGNLDTVQYLQLAIIALLVSVTFVLAGYRLCRLTHLPGFQSLSWPDLGVYYYAGMALFLVIGSAIAMLSGSARGSLFAVIAALVAASAHTIWREHLLSRTTRSIASHARMIALWSPVAAAVLCLVHYVITQRGGGGTGWFYADLATHVATVNTVPLVNRHYGQSLLASLGLSIVGVGGDRFTYPQVALDTWLFLSQVALALVFYRVLAALGVGGRGRWAGTFILMFGGTALSFVPHIVYDHDYPFVFNLYTDSLFGIAGWLIIILFLIDRARPAPAARRPMALASLAVPALIVATFNATAELNILIVLLVVASVLVLNVVAARADRRIPATEVAVLLVAFAVAAASGSLQGGVFAGRTTSAARAAASPFWESTANADSARVSISDSRWWYLPHVVLGVPTGFGNLPAPAAMMPGPPRQRPNLENPALLDSAGSANARLLERFQGLTKPAVYDFADPWYLVELRVSQAVRVLWFPLLGLSVLGWLSAAGAVSAVAGFFWRVATVSFALGVGGVVLANSPGGDAFYWKWALTRVLEPGLCLAMIALIVAADHVVSRRQSPAAQRLLWGALALLMTASTLLRILGYPSLVG